MPTIIEVPIGVEGQKANIFRRVFVKDPVQSGIISMIGDVGDDISPPRMLHCFALRLFLGA